MELFDSRIIVNYYKLYELLYCKWYCKWLHGYFSRRSDCEAYNTHRCDIASNRHNWRWSARDAGSMSPASQISTNLRVV